MLRLLFPFTYLHFSYDLLWGVGPLLGRKNLIGPSFLK